MVGIKLKENGSPVLGAKLERPAIFIPASCILLFGVTCARRICLQMTPATRQRRERVKMVYNKWKMDHRNGTSALHFSFGYLI